MQCCGYYYIYSAVYTKGNVEVYFRQFRFGRG